MRRIEHGIRLWLMMTQDGIGVSVKVEVSHNAGRNQTSENSKESLNGSMMSNRVMENTVPASSYVHGMLVAF